LIKLLNKVQINQLLQHFAEDEPSIKFVDSQKQRFRINFRMLRVLLNIYTRSVMEFNINGLFSTHYVADI
jgi:hypothetical protein